MVRVYVGITKQKPKRTARRPRAEEEAAAEGGVRTVALKDGSKIARVPGVSLVYTNTYTGIPAAFTNLLANVPALHEVVVFITVRCALKFLDGVEVLGGTRS